MLARRPPRDSAMRWALAHFALALRVHFMVCTVEWGGQIVKLEPSDLQYCNCPVLPCGQMQKGVVFGFCSWCVYHHTHFDCSSSYLLFNIPRSDWRRPRSLWKIVGISNRWKQTSFLRRSLSLSRSIQVCLSPPLFRILQSYQCADPSFHLAVDLLICNFSCLSP